MGKKFDPVSIAELRRRKRVFSKTVGLAEATDGRSKRDGRSLRATSRSEQLNIRVTKAFKSALHHEAEATGLTMAEVMEEAWEAYRAQRDMS